MAQLLMNALINPDYPLQELKTLLQSPSVQKEIYLEIDDNTALFMAIKEKKSAEIVKEVLKASSYAYQLDKDGQYSIQLAFYSMLSDFAIGETPSITIIKLLLKNKFYVNNHRVSFAFCFCCVVASYSNIEVWIPFIQLILQHFDISTRNATVNNFIDMILIYRPAFVLKRPERKQVADNMLLVMRLFLESGTNLKLVDFKRLFELTLRKIFWLDAKLSMPVMARLLKIMIPYIFVNDSSNELLKHSLMRAFDSVANTIPMEIRIKSLIPADIFIGSVGDIWCVCSKQSRDMRSDILANDYDMQQTLQRLCEPSSNETIVTSEALYDILERIFHNKYPHFSDVLRNIISSHIMNGNVAELYTLVLQRSRHTDVMSYDSLYHVMKYLSKEDVLNYWRAFFPENARIVQTNTKSSLELIWNCIYEFCIRKLEFLYEFLLGNFFRNYVV